MTNLWLGTDSTNPYPDNGLAGASPAEIFMRILKERSWRFGRNYAKLK